MSIKNYIIKCPKYYQDSFTYNSYLLLYNKEVFKLFYGGDFLVLQFSVLPAIKCPKKDVITALDIYCKTVDQGSMTCTNQIKDYIWNYKEHNKENRTMFFYLMYDKNQEVIGFAEYAYLPQTQVLVLDYICTSQRNHMLFYNFYHMVLSEITYELKKNGQFIRYVITELSLNQKDEKLIDVDSNYFRHLLSNENYRLLKYPYYQPPLFRHEKAAEFNIAIKLVSSESDIFSLPKDQYLLIIEELYTSHYLTWFKNEASYPEIIQNLLSRIKSEIPKNEGCDGISLIQCHLFEEGHCPKFTAENISIPKEQKRKLKVLISIVSWVILSIITFFLCLIPQFNSISTVLCSFFTIIAGIITIFSFRHEIFGSK